jgi:hypothetical protein
MEQLTVGAEVWTPQQETDLHELGHRVAQALRYGPARWAPWPA